LEVWREFDHNCCFGPCRRDPGIDLKISRRIRKSGIVLKPEPHFAEVFIENVLSTVLRFIVSWAPIDSFPVGYRPILTDEFLRKYTRMTCWEDITSLATGGWTIEVNLSQAPETWSSG
jgi:hypothetical protein